MTENKNRITLLHRKRSPSFNSIEEIFDNLSRYFKAHYILNRLELPFYSNGLINKIKNIFFVSKLTTDLLHITGEIYYTGLLFKGKMIVTVHDMGSLKTTNRFKRLILKTFWFQRIANKAEAITLISEFSRREYLDHVNVDESKVRVIHNPVSDGFTFQPKDKMPDKPVILHLGTKPNKNLPRLIDALKGIPCSLRIIGKLNTSDMALLKENNIEFESKHGLEFKEVIKEYEACDIVSFVSTYEGFGMPIIEAQATGRPVISSNLASIPEVSGKGALLVDPYSSDEIKNAINKVISDNSFRLELIREGQKNLLRFKPDTIAKEYVSLYQQILNG